MPVGHDMSTWHTLCCVLCTGVSHGEEIVSRWLRGNTVVSLVMLKPCSKPAAPFVLLLEQNDGQELWVRYQELGWKMYSRGAGGGEIGWEVSLEGGRPGGDSQCVKHNTECSERER